MKGERYHFGAVGHAFKIAQETELKPHEFAIFITIAGHYKQEDNGAFPSVERLTRITGISKASAHRAINGLTEKGLIAVEKAKGEGKQYTHNVYRLPGYVPEPRAAGRPKTTKPGTFDNGTPYVSPPGQPQEAGYFS